MTCGERVCEKFPKIEDQQNEHADGSWVGEHFRVSLWWGVASLGGCTDSSVGVGYSGCLDKEESLSVWSFTQMYSRPGDCDAAMLRCCDASCACLTGQCPAIFIAVLLVSHVAGKRGLMHILKQMEGYALIEPSFMKVCPSRNL